VLTVNRQVFEQYLQYALSEDFSSGAVQSLGGHLVRQTGWAWLRWAPVVAAAGWSAWFAVSRRREWQWQEAIPPLVVAGVVAAPYAFTFDQVLLLAALIPAVGVAELRWFLPAAALVNVSLLLPALGARGPVPTWQSTTAAAWGALWTWAWLRRRDGR